jgi:hypothetical protein
MGLSTSGVSAPLAVVATGTLPAICGPSCDQLANVVAQHATKIAGLIHSLIISPNSGPYEAAAGAIGMGTWSGEHRFQNSGGKYGGIPDSGLQPCVGGQICLKWIAKRRRDRFRPVIDRSFAFVTVLDRIIRISKEWKRIASGQI